MIYEQELHDEIQKYMLKGWDNEAIASTLAYKYKIRRCDIEAAIMGEDNRRTVRGWLNRKGV